MKKLLIITAALFVFNCSSKDDCEGKKAEINARYDATINQERTTPLSKSQIDGLNYERSKELGEACD